MAQDKPEKKAAPEEKSVKKQPETDKRAKAEVKAKAEHTPKAKSGKLPTKRPPLLERTQVARVGEHNQGWKLIDVTNIPLGRVSSHIALLLMGKTKAIYTPFIDTGDFVIVINAEKVKLTGAKWQNKLYQKHTNYPGGLKTSTAQEVLESAPQRLVEEAVWRMLPKRRGHMARHWFKKLKVYAGAEHPHKAQQPEMVKLPNLGTWE